MANENVGDAATAAGYPLVPNTGEDGQVRYGAREINRTRDMIAEVRDLIPGRITTGNWIPSNNDGQPGDIHFRTL